MQRQMICHFQLQLGKNLTIAKRETAKALRFDGSHFLTSNQESINLCRKEDSMDSKKIKLERLQLGFSQQKMAERLGVTRRTIINYETGATHVPDTVTKLHNCLKEKARREREEKLNS